MGTATESADPVHLEASGPRGAQAWARLYAAFGSGIVLLSLLLKLWAMRQWSWFQDDWSYVERTVGADFLSYVFQEYNGHFMPLQFLGVWLITWLDPLNFQLATGLLALVILGGTLTWWALLHSLFGVRPQALLGLSMIAFCPLLLQPTLWWAAGLQTYSLIWGIAAVLFCQLRYLEGRGAVWLPAALGAFALSLAAWQKSLLIVIPAAMLALVLPGVARVGTTYARRRAWTSVVGLGVVAVVYACIFLFVTAQPTPGEAQLRIPGVEPMLGFALTAGLGVVLPAMVGGTWEQVTSLQGAFPLAPTWVQWATALAGFVLAAACIALRRKGVWVVLLPLAYALAAWALVVGSSRFATLGQYASMDSRYSADIIPVAALAFVYALTSTRVERKAGGAWLVTLPRWVVRSWHAISAGAIVVIIMSSLVTWSVQMDGLGPVSPRSWTDRLIGSARALGPATIFNSNAPDNVVYPAFLPDDARISRMLAPLGLPLSFNSPTDDLLIVASDGSIVPGKIAVQSQSFPGPVPGCGYLLEPGAAPVEVPLSKQMYNWDWGLEMGFLAQGPTEVLLSADLVDQSLPLPAGLGSVESVIVSSLSVVKLSVPQGSPNVCVDYLAFGPVDPAEAP